MRLQNRTTQLLVPAFLALATSCVPAKNVVVHHPLMSLDVGGGATPAPLALAELPLSFPRGEWLSLAGELVPGRVAVTPAAPFVKLEGDVGKGLECLALTIYHEARSEPEDGQRAVAQVVLNRVRHYAYPSTICGVVFQGASRASGCQFTFTCDGSLSRRREDQAWLRARRIAEEALEGYVHSPVGLATHYHTKAVRPYWSSSLRELASVGDHIFYRSRGEAGLPSAFVRRSSSKGRAAGPA